MPYINRTTKKRKRVNTFDKQKANKVYASPLWAKIVYYMRMEYPICQHCLKNGITSPTEEIHHIVPFSFGKTDEEIRLLAYSYDNVVSLCIPCHKKAHKLIDSGDVDRILYHKIITGELI